MIISKFDDVCKQMNFRQAEKSYRQAEKSYRQAEKSYRHWKVGNVSHIRSLVPTDHGKLGSFVVFFPDNEFPQPSITYGSCTKKLKCLF